MLISEIERENEKIAWDLWVVQYPYMNEKNFIPFNDFKEQLSDPQKQSSNKTDEDIEEEILKVVAHYEGK